jgi:hypothetical protein
MSKGNKEEEFLEDVYVLSDAADTSKYAFLLMVKATV